MRKTLRSAGGAVLLMPKFGSNEFVAVKNSEKPKAPILSEQRIAAPLEHNISKPTLKRQYKKQHFPSKNVLPNAQKNASLLPDIGLDQSSDIPHPHMETENSASNAMNALFAPSSSEIDASTEPSESETENSSSNIGISSIANSKRTKAIQKSSAAKKIPLAKQQSAQTSTVPSFSIEKNLKKSFPSSKEHTLSNAKAPIFSDSHCNNSNVIQKTETFISSSLQKRHETEKVLNQLQRKFNEYQTASNSRRKEQENQINSLLQEHQLKNNIISMYERITGLSLQISDNEKSIFQWKQQGKAGSFECQIECLPDNDVYRYKPITLPESINEMDEPYQTFKNEIHFSAEQMGLFFKRVENILDFESKN